MSTNPKLAFKPRRMWRIPGTRLMRPTKKQALASNPEMAYPVLILPADPASVEALRVMIAGKLAITSLNVESAYAGSCAILAALGFKLPKAK